VTRQRQRVDPWRMLLLVGFLLGFSCSGAAESSQKPPYRLLYNSDTTHILTCTSEWRLEGEQLSAQHFLESVDEAADAVGRVVAFGLPAREHRARAGQPLRDHRV